MRISLVLAALFLASLSYGQTVDLQIGYQEFPTTIMAHASDNGGAHYYMGVFKGQLKVNNQVLSTGQGQEDLFWVKTNAAGALVHHATFGSAISDAFLTDGMVMGAGEQLYFFAKTGASLSFGPYTVDPYGTASAPLPTAAIVRLDTAGTVRWVRKTNLNLIRIFTAGPLVHVIGTVNPSTGAILNGNTPVLDSLGKPGLVYMVYDTSGQFLGSKTILQGSNTATVTLNQAWAYSDNRILLSLRAQGPGDFSINGTSVTPPSNASSHYLIRLDTSFAAPRVKLLTPQAQNLYGAGTSSLTATLAPSDSLYLVLAYENGAPVSIDGFNLGLNKNTLLVLDTGLVARRAVSLGSSLVAPYPPSSGKRKVYFRNLATDGSSLYFTGQYVGINESPMNAVPAHDTTVNLLLNAQGTVDLNGVSKSFLGRTNLGATTGNITWYGDHHEYEQPYVYPFCLHVKGDRLVFLQGFDNVWNPFIADTALNLLSGAMRRNADRPETPVLISFFDDGARLVIGQAQGKTALDSTAQVPSNSQRRDLFLACLNPDGSARWFKRFSSTLLQQTPRKLLMRNGTAYFLAAYSGSQSDSNFIRINNTLYDLRPTATLLARVDASGNLMVLNLSDASYKYGNIVDFAFFSNGDLALLVTSSTLPLAGFPPQAGIYLLRVSGTTGALIQARKLVSSQPPNALALETDAQDNLYFNYMVQQPPGQSTGTLYLYNGPNPVDSVTMVYDASGSIPHMGLVRLTLDAFAWNKRMYGAAGANPGTTSLTMSNNHPVLVVTVPQNNQPLLWEGQAIPNGPSTSRITLAGISANGVLIRSKALTLSQTGRIRKGVNDRLYLCVTSNLPIQIDTISIANAGFGDAIGLVLDSNFTAKRHFRLASPLSENMLDMDIYHDSLAAFAYVAQTVPQLYNNRNAVLSSDYDPDAFITTQVLTTGVITALPDVPDHRLQVLVAPNPIRAQQLVFSVRSETAVVSGATVFSAGGQRIAEASIRLRQGEGRYSITLPSATPSGMYYLILSNGRWKKSVTFLVRK